MNECLALAACIRIALELEEHYYKLHTAHTVFIDCVYWCSLLAVSVHPYLQEEHRQKTRERKQSDTETGKTLYIPAH